MKHIARLFILFFLAVVTAACSNANAKTSCGSLLPDIPNGEINTDLTVIVPKQTNTFKIGDEVDLVADVHSTSLIEVVPDKDLKIFQWTGSSWSEVKNQMYYSSVTHRLSIPTSDVPASAVYPVSPDLPPQFTSVQTCIVLRGVEDPDSSRINVGAYVEFTMYP